MKNRLRLLPLAICYLLLPLFSKAQSCTPAAVSKTNSIKVYAHYMPWFDGPVNPSATGTSYSWGYHWTANGGGANPNTFTNVTDYTGATVSVRNIDAHYHPLIGPYEEQDPYVIEYHFLLMKLAGIDGIMIDWYGLGGNGAPDAGTNQDNTAAMISNVGKYGLKYGLVMEDAAWTNAQANGNYARDNYFTDPNYIKLGDMRGSGDPNANAPLVAVFGPQQFKSQGQWNNILSGNTKAFLPLYGQAAQIGTDAGGTFVWPYPQAGQGGTPPAWYNDNNSYYTGSYYTGGAPNVRNNKKEGSTTLGNNVVLGSAYQGFYDYYGGGGASQYGIIPRNYGASGNTLKTMLDLCNSYKSELDAIQIATWNDFSEGTIIEPTVEFGFQSLVTIQQFTGVSYTENDLKEIYKLFQMRKQYTGNSTVQGLLDQAACMFASLQVSQAEALVDCIQSTGGSGCSNFPAINSAATASVTVNNAFSYTITATNSPTSYNASGLPTGLNINTSTGVISGTPQNVGTYSVTLNATNSSGTGTKVLTLTVNQPATLQPYLGTAATIPGTIQTENYDYGGQGVAYNDNDAANNGGQYRTNEGVDIETCSDAGGGYDVGWTVAGEWIKYTVNVTQAGTYTMKARVATGAAWAGKKFHVMLDGTNIGTVSIPKTGDWETFQDVNVTTPTLTTGLKTLQIVEDSGDYNINYLQFTLNNAPPTVTSNLTATGTTGTAFTYTIIATGSPTSYSATGLPSWASLNTSTGVISGTPSTTGITNVTLSATNTYGTGPTATLVLTVNPPAPVITSPTTATDSLGYPFSYTIVATNSPTSYSATGLPSWASLNTSTGVISGTPTATGNSTVTISAINAGGTTNQTLTITVTTPVLSTPYNGTAAVIPGIIQCENYDVGGQDVAYHDNDVANQGANQGCTYRTTEQVDVENCSDIGGGYDVGYTDAGEWLQYTVNVTLAGTYTIQFRAASNNNSSSNTIYMTLDGVNISGTMTIPQTGDWQTYTTVTATTPVLATGLHKLRVYESTGGYNFNYMVFSVNALQACTNANTTLIAELPATTGSTYQWQVSTNGGSSYSNVSNSGVYSGAATSVLTISSAPSTMYGYLYRCAIINGGNTTYSTTNALKFAQTWTGAVSSAWETAGNWSCGVVPDSNTDVIFNSGTAVINSNVTIRSLNLNTSSSHLTVNSGHSLTVLH